MNIILLGACVLVACFGIFTALLGSGKPKLFGAFFGIMLGSGLAIVVCKALGFSLTSIPVAVAMGVASVILLALAIWKEAASLLIISICGGLYIGGGLVYGVMTLFSIQLDWVIGGLAAAILVLIFAALCLIRPSNGILIATSMVGGALVSISGSIILYMILNIAASAGFIGDLLALYTALSPNTILLIWVFGLLLGGGAMLLQSLLMKSVEDVDDGSWEDWEPEYEEEEEPIVVKRGARRKKKKQLVEPYDWGEPEESDSYDAFDEQKDWSDEPEEEVPYEETVEKEEFVEEDPVPSQEHVRTVIPPVGSTTNEEDGSTKVFRKVVLPQTETQSTTHADIPSHSPISSEETAQAESHKEHAPKLSRPTFPPRSQRRK